MQQGEGPLARRALVLVIPVGLLGNGLYVFSGRPWLADLGLVVGGPALAAVYVTGLSLLSLLTSTHLL